MHVIDAGHFIGQRQLFESSGEIQYNLGELRQVRCRGHGLSNQILDRNRRIGARRGARKFEQCAGKGSQAFNLGANDP